MASRRASGVDRYARRPQRMHRCRATAGTLQRFPHWPCPMKLLIAGATGLVGRHLLALALADPRITCVVAPARRPLQAHARLFAPQVDFDRMPGDADWW